jgi:Na+-translocating ferredoxin:NAD+ oxidoreductase RnfC subunit
MKEYRRVPLHMLRRRLKVEEYETAAPYEDIAVKPERVRILLTQHAGKPSKAVVATGAKIGKGDVVGRVDAADLGANVHASIDGTVAAVTESYVEIAR